METIEGNKLIAEFMDLNDDLYFHVDWRLLMQVVETIEEIKNNLQHFTVIIEKNRCQIFDIMSDHNVKTAYKSIVASSEHVVKITAVWQATVKFIRWYNTTKPQPNAK